MVSSNRFSIREAQGLVKDLGEPKAWIYWTDFLSSIIVGHVLFHAVLFADRWMPSDSAYFWPVRVTLFAINVLLYSRAAMFTHELVHLPRNGFKGFRIVWNLLCGIPFMIPSFTYYPHVEHHRRKHYGTEEDGEYLNLSHRPPSYIVGTWFFLCLYRLPCTRDLASSRLFVGSSPSCVNGSSTELQPWLWTQPIFVPMRALRSIAFDLCKRPRVLRSVYFSRFEVHCEASGSIHFGCRLT